MTDTLAPFVTVPRPHKRVWYGARKGRYKGVLNVYFSPDERDVVKHAAALCGCTASEFVKQSALNVIAALGVSKDGTRQDV
jgi:hypothetical protein